MQVCHLACTSISRESSLPPPPSCRSSLHGWLFFSCMLRDSGPFPTADTRGANPFSGIYEILLDTTLATQTVILKCT